MRFATFAALTLLVSTPPLSGEEALDPADLFAERIGLEIVNVDVVVTDKKGRAVEGLDAEDFVLRIDGREVEIANFYAVSAAAGTPDEDVVPESAAVATRDPLHLVVYLDSFYLTPISRKRVLEELPEFLERQIADGARILLATHLQDLEALTPFTTDLDELERALARVAETPSVGIQQTTGHRLALRNVQDAYRTCQLSSFLDPCVDCFAQMIEMARFYSLQVLSERRAATATLGGLVDALTALGGRKALLYVSDGLQVQPGLDLFYYIGDQLCPDRQQDLQEHYMRRDVGDLDDLVARANASRVTLYALETGGLRSYSAASAEYESAILRPSGMNDMIRIANLQSALHYLSTETGGRPILNANDYTADLAEIGGELRTFYSLGYRPEHPGKGHAHRVSVKVPGGRYEVRYRRSFLHKSAEQQLADRALGAVFFGVADNPLGAAVEARTQRPGEAGRVVVPLEVSVPLGRLTLLPRQGARDGRMTVVVAAPDEMNDQISVRRKDFPVTAPLADGLDDEDVYRFGVNVELFPGSYRLGVGVWDDVGAVGSFLNVPVEVAAPAAGDGGVSE